MHNSPSVLCNFMPYVKGDGKNCSLLTHILLLTTWFPSTWYVDTWHIDWSLGSVGHDWVHLIGSWAPIGFGPQFVLGLINQKNLSGVIPLVEIQQLG